MFERANMTIETQTLPLSCYIRTLNESSKIAEVIHGALQVAAEVVVIDSGSTDGTVEIAEQAGARVVRIDAWPGNGFQKRIGEEACHYDWLLDLDADEVVTPELAQGIRALFADGAPLASVYEIKLVNVPPVGKPWWSFNHLWRRKLYDRRVVRMPEHRAWDQLPIPKTKRLPRVDGAILHYSFRDLTHVIYKRNRVSSRRAQDSKRKSKPELIARVWFAMPAYFIRHYFARGLWRAGTYGFVFAINSAHGRWLRDAKQFEMTLMDENKRKRPGRDNPEAGVLAKPVTY